MYRQRPWIAPRGEVRRENLVTLRKTSNPATMSLLVQLLTFSISLYTAYGVGGPYPPSFDCPMRQLALEFAQDIQPWLTTTSLQEIADALNGYDTYTIIYSLFRCGNLFGSIIVFTFESHKNNTKQMP